MAPRTHGRGSKSDGEVPGKGVLVEAVNRAGAFPKRYKGLNWKEGEDPWPNMVRGKIGEDVAEQAAKLRGEKLIGSQVKVNKADATSVDGSSNIDHIVEMPKKVEKDPSKYEGIEVKTGNATLSDGQQEHYPNVPKGGLKLMTDKLSGIQMPHGHILQPGEISGIRLERWDIDSMPGGCKEILDQYTIGDIIEGKAGKERAEELRNWILDNPYEVEQRWT